MEHNIRIILSEALTTLIVQLKKLPPLKCQVFYVCVLMLYVLSEIDGLHLTAATSATKILYFRKINFSSSLCNYPSPKVLIDTNKNDRKLSYTLAGKKIYRQQLRAFYVNVKKNPDNTIYSTVTYNTLLHAN